MTSGRSAVGLGAAVATFPYLALKGLWLGGSSVGMNDPAYFDNSMYLVGNVLSFLLDGAAVAVALALTYPWGQRLPGWVVLLPMWVATGLLGTIVVLLPVVAPFVGRAPTGGDPDPLKGWVYVMVYAGFAVQGVLLSIAFALYVRQRWPRLWSSRLSELTSPRSGRNARLTLTLSATGVLLGSLHVAWGFGASLGLGGLAHRQTAIDRATLGVYGGLICAAAAGVLLLGQPRAFPRLRALLPLTLTWCGTGSMVAWGLYFLAITAANPSLSSTALTVATIIKVVLAALMASHVLSRSSQRPRICRHSR